MKPNWLTRILFTLTTLVLVVLGFFFLTIALAIGAVVALVFGIRLWWTLRKLKREQGSPGPFSTRPTADGNTVVEGEFQVIEQETRAAKLPTPPANNTPPAP